MSGISRLNPLTRRWNRALTAYAASVTAELAALGVHVIDFFVDVTNALSWIDLAVVDPAGCLVEFHFSVELGWLHVRGQGCGRLTTSTTAATLAERAAQVAPPPSRVAAEMVAVLVGHDWAADQSVAADAPSGDLRYLSVLLAILEVRRF